MPLSSKVGIAKKGSPSLRATIPEGIVDFLGLKLGNKIVWKMKTPSDDKSSWYATVEKAGRKTVE